MSLAFTIAPASDRTLDAGAYLLGAAELALILGPLIYAAWRLQRTFLGWAGAPARVAEAVLATFGLIALAELLGTFAAFDDVTMVVGALVIGAAAHFGCARVAPRELVAPPAPSSSRLAVWLAAGAVAVVAAAWMVPTLGSLAGGMDRADSLWYHMPLATRFAHGAHFGAVDYFDPIFFASFYPANSEVVHATGILAFDRDILSPLLNLGWLALGLTSAYAIGRPYGVGPQSLIGGAIALGAQNLVEFQAGEALNDIVGVAMILACVAILVNAWAARRGPRTTRVPRRPMARDRGRGPGCRPRGGHKALVPRPCHCPVRRADRSSPGVVRGFAPPSGSALPAFLAGGYWFVRNLINVGNPIPYTTFGPLGLPSPERAFELRPGYSVFHYATDTGVWKDWFFPGLHDSFGLLWPLVLAAFIGGGIYAVWRGGDPLVRVLGAVVLFTAAAYVVTPLTAAGEEGAPIAFEWNVRYLAPAAAIGLALLPALPSLRRSETARDVTLGALCILFAATTVDLVQWQQGHVKGAIAAGIGVLAVFALIQALRSRDRWGPAAPVAWVAGLLAVVAIGALGAGWWEQRHYLERRYENLSPNLKLAEAVRWARDLRDANVAVSGHPRRLQPVPLLRHRPLQPRPVARARGPRRRLRADPDLRRSGARRSPTVTTRTSSRPTTRSTRAR